MPRANLKSISGDISAFTDRELLEQIAINLAAIRNQGIVDAGFEGEDGSDYIQGVIQDLEISLEPYGIFVIDVGRGLARRITWADLVSTSIDDNRDNPDRAHNEIADALTSIAQKFRRP